MRFSLGFDSPDLAAGHSDLGGALGHGAEIDRERAWSVQRPQRGDSITQAGQEDREIGLGSRFEFGRGEEFNRDCASRRGVQAGGNGRSLDAFQGCVVESRDRFDEAIGEDRGEEIHAEFECLAGRDSPSVQISGAKNEWAWRIFQPARSAGKGWSEDRAVVRLVFVQPRSERASEEISRGSSGEMDRFPGDEAKTQREKFQGQLLAKFIIGSWSFIHYRFS